MLPKPVRTLSIGLYFFISWKFLTTAALLLGAAVLFTLQLDITGPLLLPFAAFTGTVGWMALMRLRTLLTSPYY
jgi:hypothetical protein